VFGSTPAGVLAAVAAARYGGAAVTLLDPSPRVGGMCSGGLGVTDEGDPFAIGGLAREFFLRNARHYNASAGAPLYKLEPHVAELLFLQMLAEANVTRVRVAAVAGVALAGARVAALALEDGSSVPIPGVVVDASYEAQVVMGAARALPPGAAFATFGREAAAVYNESWGGRREPFGAPFDSRAVSPLDASGALLPLVTTRLSAPLGAGDARVQGYNFRLCAVRRGESAAPWAPMPDPPPGSYDAAQWELLRRFAALPGMGGSVDQYVACGAVPSGKLDCNNGALISTDATGLSWGFPAANASQRAALAAAHRAYTVAFFYTLRTDPAIPPAVRASAQALGLCADEFVANGNWPEQLYVREAARLVGDRVLVQGDLWPATDFGEASIGMGSYAADGHYSTRGPCVLQPPGAPHHCVMVTSEAELQAALANGTLGTGGEGYVGDVNTFALYQIPAWALFPKRAGATNLLSPTAPSASHVAFASLRVEPQYMVMGHAAGVIAAMAAGAGAAVQDVPLPELHARLAAQGAVLCHEKYPNC
jgi:hypothetical protein